MQETTVTMRFIDGPADPNSGRHMAERYQQIIPNADVVLLDKHIGHWPQIEAPDSVLTHLLDYIDRVWKTPTPNAGSE
jgi:pimeloyl-ACP methyl ester carboxylesterase